MKIKSIKLMNERHLIEAFLISQSERDFRKIYRRYTPRMMAIAINLLKDKYAVDDIIQTTWFRAVNTLDQFQWRSAFSTWVIGIVINCCSEYQRSQKKHIDVNDIEEKISEKGDHSSQTNLAIDLHKALNQLADGYRQVLMMYDIEGYTHRQIAQHLSIEIGTSKSQLSRARKQIQHFFLTDGATYES